METKQTKQTKVTVEYISDGIHKERTLDIKGRCVCSQAANIVTHDERKLGNREVLIKRAY